MENKELEVLGGRIRELRRAADLTIEQLSVRVDRTARHLQSIENGKGIPSFSMLVKLSVAFGLSLSELFDYSEARKVPVRRLRARKR